MEIPLDGIYYKSLALFFTYFILFVNTAIMSSCIHVRFQMIMMERWIKMKIIEITFRYT